MLKAGIMGLPNVGIVEVPDTRLDQIFELVQVPSHIPTAIQFVDIAELVVGASEGGGLGNKFLGNIRAVETKPSVPTHGSTHHANSHLMIQNEDGEWESYGRLSEYTYGKLGEIVPLDTCRIAPANAQVRWSIHYYPDETRSLAANPSP